MRILLVEDDQRLARLTVQVLQQEHYTVDVAYDGEAGLQMALKGHYQVAIVDWMLPKVEGIIICRAVRAARLLLAILLLTARTQVEDRVVGLDSGADDYLVKPFAFEELLARVRALSRRLDSSGDPNELQNGDIVLDLRDHRATRGGIELQLSITEWNLLACFMRNAGHALTREQIFDQVWGYDSEAQLSMVDVYVSYLRHKLNFATTHYDPIETIRSVGYRFQAK
jgi:two-component system, OmpR family, response regulator